MVKIKSYKIWRAFNEDFIDRSTQSIWLIFYLRDTQILGPIENKVTGATLLLYTSETEIYISLASKVSEQDNDVCLPMCQYQLASPLLDVIEK